MIQSSRAIPVIAAVLVLQAISFSASAQRAALDVGVHAQVGVDDDSRRYDRRYDDRDYRRDRDDDRYYRRYDDSDYRRDDDRRASGGLVGNVVGGALGLAGTATRGALGLAGQATRGSLGLANDVTTGVLGGGPRGRGSADVDVDVDADVRGRRDRR